MKNLTQKILAVIPARSGSKRVIGKNTKLLNGKPLIAWTIDQAAQFDFAKTVVSTDCDEIALVASTYGAEVPFLRSVELATDKSPVIGAVKEAIKHYRALGTQFDGVVLLQPTSPFRSTQTISEALELFKNSGGESVVSLSPTREHPSWCRKVEQGVIRLYEDGKSGNKRSQDLDAVFILNGLIYIATPDTILNNDSFYTQDTRALIVDSDEESVDIDTPFDWLVAEVIADKIGVTQ
jgi:CMP-N,N'-diacetyllegionaminic acid synthase